MTDGKSTKEAVPLKIYESAEDYLEKILMLTERNGEVRSIDIATEMGVTKPSVSIAMKNLRQAGYISMDGAGYITLEPPGLEIATRIYGRHKKLTRFFVALGVNPAVASHDGDKFLVFYFQTEIIEYAHLGNKTGIIYFSDVVQFKHCASPYLPPHCR